jgi:3-deoxy-7-phosphoheptulonate synthase
MDFLKKLPSPLEVKSRYPLNKRYLQQKDIRDKEIRDILEGKSSKFILIIGPCSANREDAVLDYVCRLSKLQKQVQKSILIIPRIYTAKPRTLGTSYKGLLHQPYLDNESIVEGILAIRRLHKMVIEETGLSGADEMVYPETIGYVLELLSYVAIGARSVENQQHRLVASGINVPVGMKNPLSGNVSVMLNAIETAQHSHHFIYHGWETLSQGNMYSHAILRGSVNLKGNSVPNYCYEHLVKIYELYKQRNVENMVSIVDCSHGNSEGNYLRQSNVALDVLCSIEKDIRISQMVKGLMIESYIEDGCQSLDGKIYGKSITDSCLGWEKTEQLVLKLFDKLNKDY